MSLVCDARYQVSFYLRQVGPVLKHCKVPKHYDQYCLKSFVLCCICKWLLTFLEKAFVWLKEVSCITKLPISKVESFMKSNLNLNHICEVKFTQVHYIWSFEVAGLLYILTKKRKGFEVEKVKLREVWVELWPKICLLRQFRTKYLQESKEIQENCGGLEKFHI